MRVLLAIAAVGLTLHLAGKLLNAVAYYGPRR
jgi:hypothetical protein